MNVKRGLTKSRVRVTATSATPAMSLRESAAAKRVKSSEQRCSPTLVSQNVLRSEGTLIRVHSVSKKVFRPKLAMYYRFVLTFCMVETIPRPATTHSA